MVNNRKEEKEKPEEGEINGQEPNQTSRQIFSKLPMDVFFDIFSRLPLKTISQCRWVCKTWCDLILHPRFAKVHYGRVTRSISPCVFLHDGKNNCYLLDHEVFDNFETSTTAYDLKLRELEKVFRTEGGFIYYNVVGSVNGLICFSPCSEPYYICNPITGEYIVLPKSPKSNVQPVVSGFGFDPIADDYKVIRILEKTLNSSEAEVYTLGSGRWGTIENVPNITKTRPSNVFVNGSLHWITHENGSKVILSFNVGTEEFNVIQPPPYLNKDKNNTFESLGVLGERLCLIDDNLFMDHEIWMMKDYGVHGSWTKEYVLRRKHLYRFWHVVHEMVQLRNGELLMLNHKQNLIYYDPLEKSFMPIVIKNLKLESLMEIRQPIIQVGSLISPKYVGNH